MSSYPWNTELEYAKALCKEDPIAKKHFQDKHYQSLLYIAVKKLEPKSIDNDSGSFVSFDKKTKSIKIHRLPDEVMEAYSFLSKYAITASCNYRGFNGSKFSTYMYSVLNGNFCRLEYIRLKKGDVNYIPRCIRELDDKYHHMLVRLRKKQNRDIICRDLEIDPLQYGNMKNEIISTLSNHGLEYLSPIEVDVLGREISNQDDNGEDIIDRQRADIPNQDDALELEELINALNSSVRDYDAQKTIFLSLYWGQYLTSRQLFNAYKNKPLLKKILKDLNIKSHQDIAGSVNNIVKDLLKIFNKKYPNEFQNLDRDFARFKELIKNFFQKIYKNE